MKLLGVDYGEKKIGLSLSSGRLAMPWQTIPNEGYDELIKRLVDIIEIEQIEKVVVGWPVGLKGDGTDQTRIVEKFCQFLQNNIKISVVKADERYSTQLAKKQGSKDDDAQAAANILQSYLDQAEDQS